MTRPGSSILRNAFAAMSLRLIVLQIGLAALVFFLAVVWLRLPDSSALSVIATVVIGLLLLAVASGGETAIALRLCNRPLTLIRFVRGSIALLVCVAVWLLWIWLISALQAHESLVAGYLNSRFPSSLRNAFSYAHIYQAMEWTAALLRWIGAGVLAATVYSIAASTRPRRAIRRVLSSASYWVVLVAGSFVAFWLTGKLMEWTPGHTLGVEMFSLILRLAIVTIADAIIALFFLAVIAACIQRSDASYETPAGGPESSQPFTAPIP